MSKFGSLLPYNQPFSRYFFSKLVKSEMHVPNHLKWPSTLNSQTYLAYTKYLSRRHKFWSVSLTLPFSRCKVAKIEKVGNAPNGLRLTEYWAVKLTRPKCWSVLLYGQPFSICRTFYTSPLSTMLKTPPPLKKKGGEANLVVFFFRNGVWNIYSHMVPCKRKRSRKKKKKRKIQNLYFTLNDFGRHPP